MLSRPFTTGMPSPVTLATRLSRVMFAKLARILLDMEGERRRELLKRKVLPAIFDGRPDLNVLHAFSDSDLAESLCLLSDSETSGTAVAYSALDQLKWSRNGARRSCR